jgi:hypothetical protein
MAKKRQSGEVNKSEAIRGFLKEHPKATSTEAIKTLAAKGIKVKASLFYFVKGNLKGRNSRRKKARQMVANVSATMSINGPAITSDVVATILKVKHLAADVGGLKKLKALVEALGE